MEGCSTDVESMDSTMEKLVEHITSTLVCVKNGTCTEEAQNVISYFENAQKASRLVMRGLDDMLREEKSFRYSH